MFNFFGKAFKALSKLKSDLLAQAPSKAPDKKEVDVIKEAKRLKVQKLLLKITRNMYQEKTARSGPKLTIEKIKNYALSSR